MEVSVAGLGAGGGVQLGLRNGASNGEADFFGYVELLEDLAGIKRPK